MVALNMDFSNIPPSSGGGQQLPPSPPNTPGWLVQITSEEMKAMKDGQGQRLIFTLQGLEGDVNGRTGVSSHNVQHPKQDTVNIAWQEIAAIGWACGVLNPGNKRLNDTSQLFGKPFRVIVVQSADPRYTEIVGFRTPDGQDPARLASGQGPTQAAGGGQSQLPPGSQPGAGQVGGQQAGFQPGPGQGQQPQGQQGGQNWGGQPQGQQAGGWGGASQGGQPQGQGQQPQQGGGQGWGGPQGGQQQQQPQQNGQGWGGPQNGQQPQGNGGGWGGPGGGQQGGGWGGQQ